MRPQPRFGSTLRAYRLGYHKMEGIGFVRIRAGGPPWILDLCPFDISPPTIRSSGDEHIVWWEGDNTEIVDAIQQRVAGLPIKEVTTISLGDDGEPWVEEDLPF